MFKFMAAIALLVLGVLVYAAFQPNRFAVERSIEIQAPPEKVYVWIEDFHRWQAWSPWEKLDPAMRRTFSGPDQGVGATYAWAGDQKVGEGRMEILEATAPQRVLIKLDFLSPFEAHNQAEFTLSAAGETTTVRWVMSGPSPYMTKLMGVFFSMDSMVGKDFEAGLASLKARVESEAAAPVVETDKE